MSNLDPHPPELVGDDAPAPGRRDLLTGREVALGRYSVVQRMLPHTNRRMVGAWCFLDHFGPDAVYATPGMWVPPHPHCGLQTVTWLLDGAVEHRDSLGTVATIRPGQLNLMTAGHGIAHSEESPEDRPPTLHGLQLWIALPAGEAHGPSRFEHHEDLPVVEAGAARVTVVIGSFGGATSPARVATPIVGADIAFAAGGSAVLPIQPDFEYAVLVTTGTATIDGADLSPGALLYLGSGRSALPIEAPPGARVFLIGGEPFPDELVMWWNFVARSHEEIVQARTDWQAEQGQRFGVVEGFDGDRLPAPEMPTVHLVPRGREGRPLPS